LLRNLLREIDAEKRTDSSGSLEKGGSEKSCSAKEGADYVLTDARTKGKGNLDPRSKEKKSHGGRNSERNENVGGRRSLFLTSGRRNLHL